MSKTQTSESDFSEVPAEVGVEGASASRTDFSRGMGNAFMASALNTVDTEEDATTCGNYVVQPGDTLWGIARRGGDPRRWQELYERNREVVGDNPDLIHPGQELDICEPSQAPEQVPSGPVEESPIEECLTRTPEEEQALIDGALSAVGGQFDGFWVSDEDSRSALGTLNGLDPSLQGRAIEQMDQGAFDTLLDQVNTTDAVGFQSLFENTHDPQRKLQLWAAYHRGQVAAGAATEAALTTDDGGWWPFDDTPEQVENARLNDRREEIVESSNSEIDDEVAFAMQQFAAGNLTEQDVTDLATRKEREHEIEMDYNVNLVNDEGARTRSRDWDGDGVDDVGSKICWTLAELQQIDNAMARMPEDHGKHNTMLTEIRRSEMKVSSSGTDRLNVGGDHGNGVIRIYDTGVSGNYRHTGDMPESVNTAVSTQTPLTPLEETVVHEIGHDVHDQNDPAYQQFISSAGWQTAQTDAEITTSGVSATQLADLKANNVSQVIVNGRVFRVDPYTTNSDGTPRFVSYIEGTIPTTALGASPNQTSGGDTWSYSRTNPKDHFAEAYQKAIHMPETLAHDLLDAPEIRVNTATAARDALQVELAAARTSAPARSPDEITALEDALSAAQTGLTDAQSDQSAQQVQWDTLRDDVFHTDTATTAAVARLQALGIPAERVTAFQAEAARLQTPEQISLLEATYGTP